MRKVVMRNLLLIFICFFCFAILTQTAQAATKTGKNGKVAKSILTTKERLVLMPLRVGEADKSRQAAMETAIVEGLQQKYEVFSGERVTQKAHEIFLKESRSTTNAIL